MINVKYKKCIYEDCKKRATFNFENEKKGKFCNLHKLNKMINVVSKICQYEDCKKLSMYNFENEKTPKFCSIHKLENMINVKSHKCNHEDCKIQPSFNFENEKTPKYCFLHKLENMVNIICNKYTCHHENCEKSPIYNFENEKTPKFCSIHKSICMIDVKHKTCKTSLCNTRVMDKYEGYCLYCYIHTFPDKPVSRNYKTKEFAVVEYVKTKFSDLTWIADKKIKDGCSKRRPDLLLDLGYQIIIVEIDENQHIDYDCSCENKRIMEISKDLDHRPIVFIRFNPDDYLDNDKNITSCWGNNKKGICVIKKSKQNEWKERLNILEETVKYWTLSENITDKTVEIIQLFYDK
jgi:hypothetical protein